MTISAEVQKIIEGSKFPTLITIKADGTPYPIVTGPATIVGETLTFGIGAMVNTQTNLASNPNAVFVFVDDQPKGIRVYGTAKADNGKLVFLPSQIDTLN